MASRFEDSSAVKKDLRSLSRSPVLRKPRCAEAAIQAIEQARRSGNGRGGGVQVKIVVSKQELRQMAASMGCGRSGGSSGRCKAGHATLDQVLHFLKRQHAKRADCPDRSCKWRPALQSIPEEF